MEFKLKPRFCSWPAKLLSKPISNFSNFEKACLVGVTEMLHTMPTHFAVAFMGFCKISVKEIYIKKNKKFENLPNIGNFIEN